MPEKKPEELAPPSLASLLLSDFERDALAHHQELKKTKKRDKRGRKENKAPSLKVVAATFEELAKKPGLDDAKWFKLADILELNFYNDILPIVTKAVTLLSEGK